MVTKQSAAKLAARAASQDFAESFAPATAPDEQARAAAAELGVQPVSPATASILSFLAAATGARAVVELGTGTGVSGLAFLSGMVPGGVLTSIDIESEHQAAARRAFLAAAIPTQRFRLIAESALNVLPRLTDGGYDIVFADADILESVEYIAQAERLLRPHGVLVLNHAFAHDRIGDPDDEADDTVIMREAIEAVTASDEFLPTLIPVGDGLLAAVRR
ncbi:O-methyltransferase [Propionicicella superfundia]|uniref:O-methyltransferase n=1 Tax=Propionicicella superfundia TaxID=348582 RepID=UPI000429B6FD|nr:class I SAM-dependent methyltransferase [Propionicicella superfundia]